MLMYRVGSENASPSNYESLVVEDIGDATNLATSLLAL
jgi:hypothetical protein